ncbi:uncharacterized protein NPIL_567191 [Nephila pilipes]|uniref:Uncharacterized protein n=1 Tax=Nephila pilipes TaxID=299642 RepID=A0A8X6P1W9_NEPPI|nr:uncharacterized protein NPIL_567191 [Nephila pilipes]
MKLLSALLFAGFLSIVACDPICMPQKIAMCFMTLTTRYLQSPICKAPSELNECIRKGAIECKEEFSPLVQDVLQTYTDTCTEGTEMNALYKKHGICVFENAAIGSVRCLQSGMTQIRKSLTMQGNMLDNIKRAACKNGHSADLCIENNLNKTCGNEAVIFRRKLSEPSIKLTQEGCRKFKEDGDYIMNGNELQTDDDSPVSSHAIHHHVAAVSHHASSLYLGAAIDPDDEAINSATTISIGRTILNSLILLFLMKLFLYY